MRQIILSLVAVTALAACAPPHHRSPAAKQNSLVQTLNAKGIPDASWSEADLNGYELDLTRLEKSDDGTNRALIQQRRVALDDARAKKLGKALSTQSKAAHESAAKILIEERNALVHDINANGRPDATWSTDRLMTFKSKLAQIDDLGRQIQTHLGRCVVDYDEFTRVARLPLNRILQDRVPRIEPLRQVTGSHLN